MDIEKLIEDLRGLLKQYGEKIPYGELVGAPWPYSRSGDLVWQDPEPYFIEQAATALSTLQAENKRLNKIVCSIPTTPDSGRTVSQYDKEMSMCAYLDDLEAENEKLRAELERMKKIMRDNGIMTIPPKYPGGPTEWNIPKPRSQKED